MNNQFADAVSNWVGRLSERINHDESALPYNQTTYDTPCLRGACCRSPDFAKALQLAENFKQSARGCSIGDVFALIGQGNAGVKAICRCFMVVHRRDRPSVLTFARLQPCGS
ncbi:MAG: hypothetical protein ACKPKO_04160, partial [Candidatus Fonsibacter sp.]